MADYAVDDMMVSVAQSCRSFKAGGLRNNINAVAEGISCRTCRNWNGSTCRKNAYDAILNDIDCI